MEVCQAMAKKRFLKTKQHIYYIKF